MSGGQVSRLPEIGRIDRSRALNFTFNGRELQGYAGDTLASALLANGVRVVNRSFKFHRPRGVLSAGVEEPNALLAVDSGRGLVPLVRATLMPLVDGLRAESQNGLPGLGFDLLRVLDYTRALWPAGFYNKTFKWPGWSMYEHTIRNTAGLGRLPQGDDPTRYGARNAHCDVLVIGAGPSGLAAARSAMKRGEDVMLVEQQFEAGGCLLHDDWSINGRTSGEWRDRVIAELNASDNVRTLLGATVAGYYDHNVLTVHEHARPDASDAVEAFWKVRAGRVVLATGAIEQSLMFGNNDLPGIMLAGAMRQYASRYGVRCGQRVVGLVNNDIGWQSVLALHDAGVPVLAALDVRPSVRDTLLTAAAERGIEVNTGCQPLQACGGGQGLRALSFSDRDGARREISCDALAMSGGLNPTVHLYSQAGGHLKYEDNLACFVPYECRQQVIVVGAAAGKFAEPDEYRIAPRAPAPVTSHRQWVDFLHDVTVFDLELAVRENFTSVEHLKRYTTVGMAVDQGKTSNLNALTVLGLLTDRSPGAVGTTTFRPQFMPVTFGAIAGSRHGELYCPARLLPAHEWHASHGAAFEDFGDWKRPAFYGAEREASIEREVRIVREQGGIFDGSPLGKIEVRGPGAAEFLNRMYVNTVPTLKPGKARYGLMLNENGIIIDDGVFVRLGDEHFLVNTTAGNAERIAAWLEEWHQCEWPDLELAMMPVTTQWAVATVAGPRARTIVQQLPGMLDLATEQFPHLSFGAGRFEDSTPYRIQRVSFSGEQSYELSVPSSEATGLFERLMDLGERQGMGLFGIEALLILRTEKGFLHVGVDTDGTTNPFDVGFGRIVANKQGDFVGARSLDRANDRRNDRRQLVGFEMLSDGGSVLAGAHFIGKQGSARRSEGYVTSACMSPTLGKGLGLGLLERGFQRMGEEVLIFDNGQETRARIVDACFYDPAGERMRA